MLLNSFKSTVEIFAVNPFGLPQNWVLENYQKVFTNFKFDVYFFNSLAVAVGTVLLTSVFSLMFAYGVGRIKWRMSKIVNTYLTTGLMIPLGVIIIPLMVTVRKLNLVDSNIGLILVYTAFNVAFASTVFYGFLSSLPYDLEEAASIDGAGIFRTFFSIIVPICKAPIATVSIFVFLNSWNEFTIALLLINHKEHMTLPMGLYSFFGQHGGADWGGLFALLTLTCFPVIILYLFFSDTIEKALTVGAVNK
jgi:raffinose/stachyose/melibiose transport system permease protein